MAYEAKVLADSLSPDGVRLTTMQVTYPHAIHKDIMTHRMFSRNFQSFRAFPPEKVIENIRKDPFIPEEIHERVPGMGEGSTLERILAERPREIFEEHIETTLDRAEKLIKFNVAKAQVNFLLQDLTWITGIITATEWDNFWALRTSIDPQTNKPFARPEVYKIAKMMRDAYALSSPEGLSYGQWHLPLVIEYPWWSITPGESPYWKRIAVGRCARVSYLTHEGVHDQYKDLELHDRLMTNGHLSPFEHVARPLEGGEERSGNFRGWHQYRKDIPYESNYAEVVENVGV